MKLQLEKFANANAFRGKGPLCVAVVVTEQAKIKEFPLIEDDFLADSGTQVAGLGVGAVQAVLNRNGVTRILAKEGGRTSRGSVGNMKLYVAFLNQMFHTSTLDLKAAETFWMDKVRDFFAGKPFTFRLDSHFGLRAAVRNLMQQAIDRQKSESGTKFVGTVMQHLVGAKLEIALGEGIDLKHHNVNQNDQQIGRTGDFDIGDVSIHVSSAPGEALIAKCRENIAAARKPLIITGRKGVVVAEGLAENAGIGDQIDIIEFEQFIATNVHELGRFSSAQRRIKLEEIVSRYNEIVDDVETDPSLKIELASGR